MNELREPMSVQEFQLQGAYIELNQLLKLEGFCGSGGEGKMLVAQGLVKVNGQVELRKTFKVRAGHVVEYAGHTIHVLGT